MTRGEAARAAAGAADHLGSLHAFREARRLVVYSALDDELGTEPIQALALAAAKPLLWPRVCGKGLEFAEALPEELVAGAFGIAAPPPGRPALSLGAGDLVLVPGRGFDRDGVRLGRGGGFYDRAPLRVPGVLRLGLAYAFQVVEALPFEAHDLRVEGLVTEEGFLPSRNRQG